MASYSWLVFALLSAFFAALVAIFGKIGLQGVDTNLATAIRAVIMAAFLVGVVALQGRLENLGTVFANHKALFFIVLSGVAGAVSWLCYFLALRMGDVSKVAPIDRLSVVFAIVFALVFLGEKLSWKAGIGAALMAAGAVILAMG